MRKHHLWMVALAGIIATATPAYAKTVEYNLVVERQPVNITEKSIEKVTVNGGIPAPVLRFKEGDEAIIHVTNTMEEETSIHWHGLLLPDYMDGVPTFGGYPGIPAGKTFTYRFPLRQTGTYWYHAHSGGRFVHGSIRFWRTAYDKFNSRLVPPYPCAGI